MDVHYYKFGFDLRPLRFNFFRTFLSARDQNFDVVDFFSTNGLYQVNTTG